MPPVNRHKWKHYLPATSLGVGNDHEMIMEYWLKTITFLYSDTWSWCSTHSHKLQTQSCTKNCSWLLVRYEMIRFSLQTISMERSMQIWLNWCSAFVLLLFIAHYISSVCVLDAAYRHLWRRGALQLARLFTAFRQVYRSFCHRHTDNLVRLLMPLWILSCPSKQR